MKTIVFILFFGVCSCAIKNDLSSSYHNHKVYRDLDKALREKDRVIILSLDNRNLKNFPISILEFKNLKYLNLTSNKISCIPKEIKELIDLENIELMDNKIERLPLEMSLLKKLNRINIAFNPIQEIDLKFLRDSLPNCIIISYIE